MKDEDVIETFFVYILFKKDKKRLNILKKINSLKKGEEVPLLNFEGGPGIVLLNFEGGSGAPLLNYEGGPGSRVSGSWSHFYTMPRTTAPVFSVIQF